MEINTKPCSDQTLSERAIIFQVARISHCFRAYSIDRDSPCNLEEADLSLKVNGKSLELNMQNGFTQIRRKWRNDDVVELELPMLIRRVIAHDSVKADRGKVALERGPIVFCAEWPDHDQGHVTNLLLPNESRLGTEFRPDLLNGIQVIRAQVSGYHMDETEGLIRKNQSLMAIPYFVWTHRGKGEMTVWVANHEDAVRPVRNPTLASTSSVQASYGRNPGAVNDQLEPQNSIDHDVPYFHWWPHKGTTELK